MRRPVLERSRNSQPQLSPGHCRMSRRALRAISRSAAAMAKARAMSSSSSKGDSQTEAAQASPEPGAAAAFAGESSSVSSESCGALARVLGEETRIDGFP